MRFYVYVHAYVYVFNFAKTPHCLNGDLGARKQRHTMRRFLHVFVSDVCSGGDCENRHVFLVPFRSVFGSFWALNLYFPVALAFRQEEDGTTWPEVKLVYRRLRTAAAHTGAL